MEIYSILSRNSFAVEYTDCEDPIQYLSNSIDNTSYEVKLDEDFIHVTTGNRMISKTFGEISQRFSHNFTMNLMLKETDEPLSKLQSLNDFTDKQTPDVINSDESYVFEFATAAHSEEKNLIKKFSEKRAVYLDSLKRRTNHKLNYFIMIVSHNMIVTNLQLTQSEVDTFCQRYQLSTKIKYSIIEKCGENPFDDKTKTEDYRYVHGVLSSLKPVFNESTPGNFFTEEYYDILQEQHKHIDESFFKKALKTSYEKAKERKITSSEKLAHYKSKFTNENSRFHEKRIHNFPMLLVRRTERQPNYASMSMGKHISGQQHLYYMFKKTFENDVVPLDVEEDIEREELLSNKDLTDEESKELRRIRKRLYTVKMDLTPSEEYELAKVGVEGKHVKDSKEVKEDRLQKKKSFHPDTDIKDIDFFLETSFIENKQETPKDVWMNLIELSKGMYNNGIDLPTFSSVKEFEKIRTYNIIHYLDMISEISTELILSARQNLHKGQFIVKTLRNYPVNMMIKTTQMKSHIFVAFLIRKSDCTNMELGKIGCPLYETENCYYTDFSSFMIPKLDHLVQSPCLFSGLFVHLLSHFNIDITKDWENMLDEKFWRTIKFLMLVFLSDKSGVEQLMTDQRYLFMSTQNCVLSDPYLFVDRLPSVLRSRLECFMIRELSKAMSYLSTTPLHSKILQTPDGPVIEYENLPSIYHDGYLTFSQKVNEFYFGYVVSKMKNPQGNSSFAMIEKICKLEFEYRDNCDIRNLSTGDPLHPKPHEFSFSVVYEMCEMAKWKLSKMLGEHYLQIMKEETLSLMSKASFEDIATLKASARQVEMDRTIDYQDIANNKKIDMSAEVPEMSQMRPKAIEALANLAEDFQLKENRELIHLIDLVPYCLRDMEMRDGFLVDLFMKDQHGGNREIYVLELRCRVVQFFVEIISKVICSKFESETLTHPKNKNIIPLKHDKKSLITFKQACSMCKSADASKWSQCHFVTKFCQILFNLTDPLFHPLIFRLCRLWLKKRIALPLDLIEIYIKHQNDPSSNTIYSRVRKTFLNGEEMFKKVGSIHMNVHSGMMQGILHFTSSVCHTILQESMATIIKLHSEGIGMKMVISIMQSSDDSGMMNGVSLEDAFEKHEQLLTYHRWKDYMGEYLSIIPSWAKTTNCALNLLEYNSTWTHMGKVIMPTIRWVIASYAITVTETFTERLQIFSNLLTDCLEGGASTFECAIIQLGQAWLHYKLLGCDSHALFPEYSKKLVNHPDPSRGFFPLDPDYSAGLFGLEFNYYCLCKRSSFGNYIKNTLDQKLSVSTLDNIRVTIGGILDNVKVSFSNKTIWNRIMKALKLPNFEDTKEYLNQHAQLLYSKQTKWQHIKYSLVSKLHQHSVIASISSHSPTSKMIAASVYLISRSAVSFKINGEYTKMSLMKSLGDFNQFDMKLDDADLQMMFPYYLQYENILKLSDTLCKSNFIMSTEYTRKSKVSVEVFEPNFTDSFHIKDVVARKWFSEDTVHVGKSYFNHLWNLFKSKYSWLADTHDETKENLQMDALQMRTFFERTYKRGRYVTLTDTSARKVDSSLRDVISRIFWPSKKLIFQSSYNASELHKAAAVRANIFSVCTFPFNNGEKEHIIKNLLTDTEELNWISPDSSKKYSILKIFHDFLSGEQEHFDIVEDIMNHKMGNIGYFSQRQKHDGSDYIGYGEWKGSINGISCRLILTGSLCKQIILQSIDLQEGSYGLRQLFRDLNLNVDNSDKSYSLYRFDGKNIKTGGSMSGVKIILDPTFKFELPDNVRETPWEFEVVNNTCRITINLNRSLTKRKDRSKSSVTLVSTTFSTRDLNVDSECLIRSNYLTCGDSSWFLKWHKWIPISDGDLRLMLRDCFYTRLDIGETIRRNRDESINGRLRTFDYEKLNSFARRLFFKSLCRTENFQRLEEKTIKEIGTDEPDYPLWERLQDLKTFEDYLNLDSIKMKWSDMYEDEDEEDILKDLPEHSGQSYKMEGLRSILQDLLEVDFDEMFVNLETPHTMLMPLTHPYFDEITMLVKKELYIFSLDDLFEDWGKFKAQMRISGRFGFFLSILFGRCISEVDNSVHSEVSSVKKLVKSVKSSVMSDNSFSSDENLSEKDIKDRIDDIKACMDDLLEGISVAKTSKVKEILSRSLQREEDKMKHYNDLMMKKYPVYDSDNTFATSDEDFETPGYTLIRMQRDNDCFYHALYDQILQKGCDSECCNLVRSQPHNHVIIIKSSLFSFCMREMNNLQIRFGEHIRDEMMNMMMPGHWAGELQLFAASYYFNARINLHRKSEILHYGPDDHINEFNIKHTGESHYDSLIYTESE